MLLISWYLTTKAPLLPIYSVNSNLRLSPRISIAWSCTLQPLSQALKAHSLDIQPPMSLPATEDPWRNSYLYLDVLGATNDISSRQSSSIQYRHISGMLEASSHTSPVEEVNVRQLQLGGHGYFANLGASRTSKWTTS